MHICVPSSIVLINSHSWLTLLSQWRVEVLHRWHAEPVRRLHSRAVSLLSITGSPQHVIDLSVRDVFICAGGPTWSSLDPPLCELLGWLRRQRDVRTLVGWKRRRCDKSRRLLHKLEVPSILQERCQNHPEQEELLQRTHLQRRSGNLWVGGWARIRMQCFLLRLRLSLIFKTVPALNKTCTTSS